MITKALVEEVQAKFGNVSRSLLPSKYKSPMNEDDFALSIAIYYAKSETVKPKYENDVLVGWTGLKLKS